MPALPGQLSNSTSHLHSNRGWRGRGTSRGEDKMLSTTPRAGATVGIEGARLVLPGRCRRCRPRRVAAKAKQSALPSELSDLLEIASRTQRGEGLTTVDREAMERACDSLVASTGSKSVVSRSTLSKTWRLVLTTEKVWLRLKRSRSRVPRLRDQSTTDASTTFAHIRKPFSSRATCASSSAWALK